MAQASDFEGRGRGKLSLAGGFQAELSRHITRWNEAEQLDVQVIAMKKKLLGAEHPDMLPSMANLANTYRELGRWNEAEQLEAQVMKMRIKLHGVEHPDTLSSMVNLASTYRELGRWNEAEELEVSFVLLYKKISAEHLVKFTGNL